MRLLIANLDSAWDQSRYSNLVYKNKKIAALLPLWFSRLMVLSPVAQIDCSFSTRWLSGLYSDPYGYGLWVIYTLIFMAMVHGLYSDLYGYGLKEDMFLSPFSTQLSCLGLTELSCLGLTVILTRAFIVGWGVRLWQCLVFPCSFQKWSALK